MITTKNASYLHMPKTGGIWVKEVLTPIIISDTGHSIPYKFSNDKIFTIVRNPWAWHVSWYNYLLHGSEKWPALTDNPVFKPFNRIPEFKEFVEAMCNPTVEFKKLSYNHITLKLMTTQLKNLDSTAALEVGADAGKKWIESNLSFYQHRINMFLQHATHVGKTETLRNDLCMMLEEVGDLTTKVKFLLESLPDINVSMKVDYKNYYSTELARLVEKTNQSFIDQFQYKF